MSEFWDSTADFLREHDAQLTQLESFKACINGEIRTEEAAEQLTTYVEASQTPLQMQQRLGALWTMLNTVAVLDAAAQPTVISILRTVRTFPRIAEPAGEGEGHMDLEDGDIWGCLCYFASDWSDGYNHWAARYFLDQDRYPNVDAVTQEAIWVSANRYAALLAATGDAAISLYGGALIRGSYAIVEALENEHSSSSPGEEQHRGGNSGKGEKKAPAVPEAAAQFFIHAASELYRLCEDEHQITSGILSKGGLWRGEGDFSLERWAFWKQRWRGLARSESSPEETRDAARQAAEAMDKVDASVCK